MWDRARQVVANVFFKDRVKLYKVTIASSDLGEDVETLTEVGEYDCNVEDNSASVKTVESGTSLPRTLRVSVSKQADVTDSYIYVGRITASRLNVSSDEYWDVQTIVEGQISKVLTMARRASV